MRRSACGPRRDRAPRVARVAGPAGTPSASVNRRPGGNQPSQAGWPGPGQTGEGGSASWDSIIGRQAGCEAKTSGIRSELKTAGNESSRFEPIERLARIWPQRMAVVARHLLVTLHGPNAVADLLIGLPQLI